MSMNFVRNAAVPLPIPAVKIVASLALAGCAALALAGGKKSPSAVVYETFVHSGVRYHMITADLSAGTIAPSTMLASRTRPVWKLIGDKQPLAAITGTFFAPHAGVPVADVLIDGNLMAKGSRGSGIAIDQNGEVKIFDDRYLSNTDWANYRFGLRGAVRVVTKGTVNPNPKAQRFRDKRIWGHAARTGLGITKSGKLVMIATTKKVTLSRFGKAMVARGIRDGISLDGGSSTCLYYSGKMIIGPKRGLVNLFVLTPRPEGYVASTRQLETPEMRVAIRALKDSTGAASLNRVTKEAATPER